MCTAVPFAGRSFGLADGSTFCQQCDPLREHASHLLCECVPGLLSWHRGDRWSVLLRICSVCCIADMLAGKHDGRRVAKRVARLGSRS